MFFQIHVSEIRFWLCFHQVRHVICVWGGLTALTAERFESGFVVPIGAEAGRGCRV
jgi:hypothetical protein